MPDLSHWDLAVTFTGREAAYLLMGVDPSGPDTERHSSRHTLERLKAAYEGAIKQAEFEGYVEPCFPFGAPEPDNLMPDCAVIRSVALWKRLDDYREHGDSSTFTGWLAHGDLGFEGQSFSRKELSRWLKENNMKSVYQFDLKQSADAIANGSNDSRPQAEKPLSVRGSAMAAPDTDIDPADLPDELSTANIAFRAVMKGYGDPAATFKNRLIDYLGNNFPGLNSEAVQRIATVANPDKAPGRKKRNAQ